MDWLATADEDGIIDQRDLALHAVRASTLHRLVRAGELTRLDRGWYLVGVPHTPKERHRLATRAMLRSHEGRAVASYHSALVLLDLPAFRADLAVVRLSRTTAGAPRSRRTMRLGRAVPPELVIGETVHPALAAVQVGTSTGPLSALVAASGALHAGLAEPQDLVRALEWATHHPRAGALRPFLALADARHASPGETRLAHALHLMKLDATPQKEVRDGSFVAYADFALDDDRVLLEFDGRTKYGRSADPVDHFGRLLPAGEIVWMEKQREDRLRELGWEVVRVTWADLDDPAALARRIRAAVGRARTRAGSGPRAT